MKLKAVLIDDEPLALDRLRRLLTPYGDRIDVVEEAMNGPEAVEQITRYQPDVIFLDIQMPGMDGFEVIQQLDVLPWVVFCTAYDEYALRAFETHALDYLLKPVDPERLARTVEKILKATGQEKSQVQSEMRQLLQWLRPGPQRRLKIRLGDKIRFVPVDQICFFRAVDKYVEVHTAERVYLINDSLNQLERELPPDEFVRIHRSALINWNYIDEVYRWFAGNYRVRMRDKNRTELPVSRAARKRLAL